MQNIRRLLVTPAEERFPASFMKFINVSSVRDTPLALGTTGLHPDTGKSSQESRLKMRRTMRYPNEMTAHALMHPPQHAFCSGADCVSLLSKPLHACHLTAGLILST
ncbi:hypothetical protein CDAR_489231 [Caerostris darwini]|uniref:Uncharacterized protein n=1 Tax=Caerostris darwini TaxID=1538125 RepID=A0AAV4SYI6_9ARAC|nr:hypothetical protein CDAR_489231 [Caerostris darwini]